MIRREAIAIVATILLVGASGLTQAAYAGDGGSSSDSAAQQYVEAVPTASGGGPSGGASSGTPAAKPKAVSITKAVRRSIVRNGGSDAAVLRQVATSPALGAPPAPRTSTKTSTPRTAAARAQGNAVSAQSAFAAAFDVGHGLPALLVLLALVTLVVAYLVTRHRAVSRHSPSRSSA